MAMILKKNRNLHFAGCDFILPKYWFLPVISGISRNNDRRDL